MAEAAAQDNVVNPDQAQNEDADPQPIIEDVPLLPWKVKYKMNLELIFNFKLSYFNN